MVGPLEFIAIEFPGNRFKGEIIPTITDLINRGLIRVIDLVLVRKDESGRLNVFELNEFDKDTARIFAPLKAQVHNLLSQEDIEKVGNALSNNSSAGLLLFEHTWSTKFIEAVKRAQGRLIADYRVPQEVAEKVLEPVGSSV
jgi:uncharacterized membrane protein